MFAEVRRQKARMPPADFDVNLRNIMNRLATRQTPMSAVCGAEAAAPVELSADEDQVIYILSNYETQFTSFIMYYAREPFKRMATLHTHLILSCTQARSNLEDDIEPESTWEAGLHEQTQLTDDNSARVVHGPRTVHYTSKFVSSQLTSKGKEVVFPVHDEKIGSGRGGWSGRSMHILTGPRPRRTSFRPTLNRSCVSPRRFAFGSTTSSGLRISCNSLRTRTGACGTGEFGKQR